MSRIAPGLGACRAGDRFFILDSQDLTGTAGTTPDYHKASLWSLVLLATEIPHELVRQDARWLLLVPDEQEGAAREEIAAFEEENRHWPAPPQPEQERLSLVPGHRPPTVLLMGALLVFYLVTGPWTASNPWFSHGAIAGEKIIREGEWWRLVTALTLHADSVHLMGNLLVGGVVVHYLCQRLGSGLGWFAILLAGILGNLVNVLLRGDHHAVGFSTAVFGTVGLLSGLQVFKRKGFGKGLLLPLGAAAGLLAFLGTAGERTDLGAHLWGLATGLGLGIFLGQAAFTRRLGDPQWQVFFFLASLLVVGASWFLAWPA